MSKNVKGDPLSFINIHSVAKYQKTRMEDSLVSSGFVGYVKINKTGTSQVGAISKAQKAQNFFLEKNLNFRKKNSFGICRTEPKNVKGGTLFDL